MNKHVETILETGQLENKDLELNRQPVNVHDLIQAVVDSYKLQLEEKPSNIHMQLKAPKPEINADEEHLLHVISNLMDNAIKYSKNTIDILVSTANVNNKIIITV